MQILKNKKFSYLFTINILFLQTTLLKIVKDFTLFPYIFGPLKPSPPLQTPKQSLRELSYLYN